MIPSDILAAFLTDGTAPSIKSRLVSRGEFVQACGGRTGHVIGYSEMAQFNRTRLLETVRRVLESGIAGSLDTVRGQQASISFVAERETIVLSSESNEFDDQEVVDLLILHPDGDLRKKIYDQITQDLGPTGPDTRYWTPIIRKGSLSDQDVIDFLLEIETSVPVVFSKLQSMILSNGDVLNRIVPEELRYYEKLCGPVPLNADPEDYIGNTVSSHRRSIVKGEFARGMDLCFVGYLRDDLAPSAYLGEEDEAATWGMLENACRSNDPFTALGALDVSLAQIKSDQRLIEISETLVRRLSAGELISSSGLNVYDYMPAVIGLVTDKLHFIEGVAEQPSFWRRLCAWTHAGLFVRLLDSMSFDPAELSNRCNSLLTQEGMLNEFVDLRTNPVWVRDGMMPRTLRCEVIGRLHAVKERHKRAGVEVPAEEAIEDAIEELRKTGRDVGIRLPGPLEGHFRPLDLPGDHSLPNEEAVYFQDRFDSDLKGDVWWRIALASQILVLDTDLLKQMRLIVAELEISGDAEIRRNQLSNLANLSLVAVAHRDRLLADAVAGCCIDFARGHSAKVEVLETIIIILMASAAIEDADESVTWLENELLRFVRLLPRGEPCHKARSYVRQLRKYSPLPLGSLAKVDAFATLGV